MLKPMLAFRRQPESVESPPCDAIAHGYQRKSPEHGRHPCPTNAQGGQLEDRRSAPGRRPASLRGSPRRGSEAEATSGTGIAMLLML